MKIAMIGQKGIPAKSGGVEKHVEELSKRLVKKGHEVIVYSRNSYITERIEEHDGVKVKIVKTIKSKNLDALVYSYRSTIKAIKEKCDIYHYHAIGPAAFCWIPKLLGKKVVVTIHGLDWKRNKWGNRAKKMLKLSENIAIKYSDIVISVSESCQQYLINEYNKENKIFFIANGVNIMKKLKINKIKKYNLEENKYILFLARLTPEKGAHYLIEAYNRLNINEKLVIAGGSSFTDEYIDELKSMAKSKNIIFTGAVSGDVLRELYSNCLLYVLPSDVEGMPLTLLEALSFGKMVLTSDIPENMYVIKNGKYGLYFKHGDVDDIEEKIKYILDNKEQCEKISSHSREYIIKNYNWDEICKLTLSLYDKLLGEV